MVVTCHPAGMILSGVKIVPMDKSMVLSIILLVVKNCPPRSDDIFEYLDKKNNEEYAYIWTVNDEWKCLDMHSFDDSKSPEVVEIPSGELDGMIDYNEDRKELQTERMIDDFIAECEREAAKLEVTVDYYIAEFL